MDETHRGSTYRVISGVHHKLQFPPEELETLSSEELITEIRTLVRIINSGRLHNEKQKKLISSLETSLGLYQAGRIGPPPPLSREADVPGVEARVIEVKKEELELPLPPQLG